MRPEHFGAIRSVGRPAVSPDGRHIAFTVSRADTDANKGRSQLWVAPADGSEPPRPLTEGVKGDAEPAWSPDGRLLAFTSHRGEKESHTTIHLLPFAVPGETVTIVTEDAFESRITSTADVRRPT